VNNVIINKYDHSHHLSQLDSVAQLSANTDDILTLCYTKLKEDPVFFLLNSSKGCWTAIPHSLTPH